MGDSVSKTKRIVGIAILIALIVVLQTVANFVKIGPVSITLSLIPIVVGAAMYGTSAGAVLGGAFGVVVLIYCISGMDIGGAALWQANPFLTLVLCLAKGILAGLAAGLMYAAVSRKKNVSVGVLCAAVVCPVVNTGVFLLALVFLYRDTLAVWAGGSPLLSYVLTGIVLVNFLPELIFNIVLGPAAARIINTARKGISI